MDEHRKVVVLGGGGFIGSNLCRFLADSGHNVTAVDVEFPAFRLPALAGVPLVHVDLRDPQRCLSAMVDADMVFHLAADMGGVGYFHSDADFAASTANGQITLNVMRAAALLETPRVFYASSACAYPTELQMKVGVAPLLTEEWVGRGTPDALYGAEKLHGLRIAAKLPNVRVGILHTVYGPLQEHAGRRMKFPAAVATKARSARTSGRLELWGDGQQRRSYLYVDDAVERIMAVMEADAYDGPVNIGAQGAVSCLEVAELALSLAGARAAEVVTNPAEPSGVLARDCDNSTFEARYGRKTQTCLTAGFGKFIDWLDEVTHT